MTNQEIEVLQELVKNLYLSVNNFARASEYFEEIFFKLSSLKQPGSQFNLRDCRYCNGCIMCQSLDNPGGTE
jgi:hypothetical protein